MTHHVKTVCQRLMKRPLKVVDRRRIGGVRVVVRPSVQCGRPFNLDRAATRYTFDGGCLAHHRFATTRDMPFRMSALGSLHYIFSCQVVLEAALSRLFRRCPLLLNG